MRKKTNKLIALLLAMLIILSMFTACGSTEETTASTEAEAVTEETADTNEAAESAEKVLNWNVGMEPRCLDPIILDSTSIQIMNNTYEGLMRITDGELVEALAESYEVTNGGLTYTFTLRDAKWSDGQQIVADDFIFAWFRMLDPALENYYSSQFFYIENAQEYYNGECAAEDVGMKALDDKTIEINLIAPTPYFLTLTAYNVYFPAREDLVDAEGAWSLNPETYVTCGPFMMSEYNINENMILVKNENYWNADAVNLDKLVVTFMEDDSSVLTAFRNGDIDVFKGVPVQEIATLQAEDPEFYSLPVLATRFYRFNMSEAPFDDVNVRTALSMAIDRSALVENVTKQGEIPAPGVVTHDIFNSDGVEYREAAGDYNLAMTLTEEKIAEAQQLLADAGYPNGEGFPAVTLAINEDEAAIAMAEAVVQMWKENLGIEIEVEVVESAALSDRRANGDFFITVNGWSADYPDPMTYLSIFTSDNGMNTGFFNNAEFDQLINDSMTLEGADRDQALLRAEQILVEDEAAIIPLYEGAETAMVSSRISGWDKSGFSGWFFGYADIAE